MADERETEMESYFGLHFPASDIPSQARELYIEKRSRVIASTEDPGLAIHTLLPEAEPVDLGATELRAVSPHCDEHPVTRETRARPDAGRP